MTMNDALDFLAALNKAEKENRQEFTCPICGGNAFWTRSQYNGHIHAGCTKCRIRVLE